MNAPDALDVRVGHGLWHRTVHLPERPAPGAPVLAATGVSLALGGRRVLDDVAVTLHAGEVVALVGPNGAGKSSLLGVLAGDQQPDAGAVTVMGRPLAAWSHRELAMRRGVLPQRPVVAFPFTVREVAEMGRSPWQGTAHEDDDEAVVAAAMAESDVADLGSRPYPWLSGGEAARASLARVLAQQPRVLLLDEPTAALDLRHQELVLDSVRARAADGDAVGLVVHDLGLAAACADRVVVLSEGRVAADGPPGEVLTSALLGAVYGLPVEVFRHPRTDALVVLPRRGAPTRTTNPEGAPL